MLVLLWTDHSGGPMAHTKEQGAHIGDRGEDIHPGVLEEAFLPHDGEVISLEVAWGMKTRLI